MIEPQFDIKKTTHHLILKATNLIDDRDLALSFLFALSIIKRIDSLIGRYTTKLEEFYDKNKELISDEKMDIMLRQITGGYSFYNVSGYTFHDFAEYTSSTSTNFTNYLNGFSNNVKEILLGLEMQIMSSRILNKPAAFISFINTVNEIDFSESSIDSEEFLELLSTIIIRLFNNKHIVKATPEWLSKLMCECLFDKDYFGNGDEMTSIYDPTCGTGVLLATASNKTMEYAVHRTNIELYGQDINLFAVGISKAIALFGGNEFSRIYQGDTLTNDKFAEKKFQYILADIPIGLPWTHIKDEIYKESLSEQGRFYPSVPDSTKDSQFLFVQHMISKMDEKGSRLAIVTTGDVLCSFKSGDNKIRRLFFENDMVEAIIRLPEKFTRFSKYLWIMTNKKSPERTGKVMLIDMSNIDNIDSKSFADSQLLSGFIQTYKTQILDTNSKIVKNDELGKYRFNLLKNGVAMKENFMVPLSSDVNQIISNYSNVYKGDEITIDYGSVEKLYFVDFEHIFSHNNKQFINRAERITQTINTTIANTQDLQKNLVVFNSLLNEIKSENFSFERWHFKVVSEISKISTGVRKPIDNLSDTGYPYLSVAYLRGEETEVELYDSKKIATRKDVLIISQGGNAGEVFQGVDGIPSSTLMMIRPKEDIIEPQFFYYVLKGNEGLFRKMANSKGRYIAKLPVSYISTLYIKIPPLHAQKYIVTKLNKLSELTNKLSDILMTKENMFTKYMQSLLEDMFSVNSH